MSEMSYVLSKNIKNRKKIKSFRSLMERAVSHNDFVKAIVILDTNNVIFTTDRYYKRAPSKYSLSKSTGLKSYDELLEKLGMETVIRFYEGETPYEFELLFILDHKEIVSYFEENKVNFFISFGLLPLLVLSLIWSLLRHYIMKPMEKLRQYAYYQSMIPKAFGVKELESIRSSMVQTFTRLEAEQKELYEIARTDELSGLANRNALNEFLGRLIADSERAGNEFAFIFLDLDHFKDVNDSLGHQVGDELLKGVASLIHEVLRSNDFVARVGGDEFVIVLQRYSSLIELINIIERIQEHLNIPLVIQTYPIEITSSMGIAFYPKDGEDVISLMQHADIAMYEAKAKGRAQYHFYTEELNAKVQENIALDKSMREALRQKEYVLYYQPKTDIKSGRVIGVEALIRWISPTKGMVSPGVFIPLAEENGFIIELGNWVLEEALNQQARWKAEGLNICVSVNIATQQLMSVDFESRLMKLLEQTNADTSMIDFEITEYLFLEQNQQSLKLLDFIHSLGISISLDDFGTGYSSLSYLKEFPIDHLKIDKAFLDDFDKPKGAVFIETIVKMGQTLGIDVIAEGVEQKEQVEYLQRIGCDAYQGYYCSKPLPADEFEYFYKKYRS